VTEPKSKREQTSVCYLKWNYPPGLLAGLTT